MIFKISTLKKSLILIPKNHFKKFSLISLSHFLTGILEVIGISVLPIVVVNLINPIKLEEFLKEKNLEIISKYVNVESSVLFVFVFLILFFLFKNILILYLNYLQRKLGIEILNWNRYLLFSNYFPSF